MSYQKRQRDYTIFGTSSVFSAFHHETVREFFSYTPHPMFILVERGILYHFTPEEDVRGRVDGWMSKYGTKEALLEQKAAHDEVLAAYRRFLTRLPEDTLLALNQLQSYFLQLLPVILVAIELPEHLSPHHDPALLELCVSIRQKNEDVYKVGLEAQSSLLAKLEQQHHLSPGILSLLTIEEFQTYYLTKSLPMEVDARRTFILIQQTADGSEFYYSPQDLAHFHLLEEVPISPTTAIQGKTAHPGIIRGIVRLVHNVEEGKELIPGEILVTAMTDPRYLAAIKRASAIVTDEGGVTCHAAIVSREFQIPCVIGTKIATQLLKTGDTIEVDATRGIVRHI